MSPEAQIQSAGKNEQQIMSSNMFCSVLQTLVMLHVLAIIVTPTTTQVDALPITSKPIESTAENLAWQAWIMMPAHQQNLEKSRKVTPKSIFILPNRVQMPAPSGDAQPLTWGGEPGSGGGLYAPIECPPGQRQFESRCISTLDIDRDQLLIQELQVLLQQGGGSTNSNNNNTNVNSYDYDYDYDEESAAPLIINEPPLVFKSSESPSSIAVANGNYDEGLGLPHQDSPLKFNIFKANFPTNTDAEQNQTQTLHSEKRVANNPDEAQFLHELQKPNATETLIFEGQKKSAISNGTESSNNTTSNSEPNRFSLGDIDAIILPAASSSSLTRPQHVSILKNDSIVQLLPTTGDHHGGGEATTTTTAAKKEVPIAIVDLLKVDSLLPLHSSSKAAPIPTTTSATTTTTPTPPSPPPSPLETTSKATIQGVTTTETLKATPTTLATTTSPGLTTPLLVASESSEHEEHSRPTTMPTPLASLLEEANRDSSEEAEKEERTRSVTLGVTSDETDTNEPETTLDSVPPTTFLPSSSSESTPSSFDQLDETTAIERELDAIEAEEVALLELQHFLEAVQHPREPVKSKQHTELKKSKVEPVEELPANRKHASNDDGDLLASRATPLPTLRDSITPHQDAHDARDDREQVGDNGQFYYREDEVEVEIAVEDGNLSRRQEVGAGLALKQIPKSTPATETITTSTEKTTTMATTMATTKASTASTIVTTTTTTTTTKPSEIDIAAELRAINELVKSRRQAAEAINKKRIPTAAVTATTAVTATPAIKSTLAISQIVKNSLVSDQDGSTSATTLTKTTDIIKTTDTSTKTAATATETTETTAETTAATTKATTGTVIASSETTPSVADTIEESANATTTATTATTDEATVMPMFSLGAPKTITTTTPEAEPTKIWENVPQTAAITTILATTGIITEATTEPTKATTRATTKATTKNFNKSLTKSFRNRNNRNGEITTSRLDRPKLGAYSFLSDNAKKVTTPSTTTPSTATATATTTSESSTLVSAASSFFPTRVPPFKELPPSEESSSPYWWLPIGWRLDPPTPSSSPITANNDLSDDDSSVAQPQSLLLRFWSAFPGNQVKVRK